VWNYLLSEAVVTCRKARNWNPTEEPQILTRVEQRLRSQRMAVPLQSNGDGGHELLSLQAEEDIFAVSLQTAASVDVALGWVREDSSRLVEMMGALAGVWAGIQSSNLDPNLQRTTEILHIMSATIHYTAMNLLEVRDNPAILDHFAPTMHYYVLLLQAVNWPVHWKRATLSKVVQSYPMINATVDYHALGHQQNEMREEVRKHPMTKSVQLEAKVEASHEFFERHQALVQWVLSKEETILRTYCDNEIRKVTGADPRPNLI